MTKGPEEIEKNSAGAVIGDFGTREVWLAAEGETGEMAYSAVIELGETDGTDEQIESDAQSLFDLLSGTSVSNAPGSVNRSQQNIDIRLEALYKKMRFRLGSQIRKDIGDGAGAAETLNPTNKFASQRLNFDFTYTEAELSKNTSLSFRPVICIPPRKLKATLFSIPRVPEVHFSIHLARRYFRLSLTA